MLSLNCADWHNWPCSWAVTSNKELLCLKHHLAKSSISAFSWLDLVSSPLYKDSMHSYVTHKNGWSTVLLKYHKPILAQIVVQVDSWIVKKRRALQRSHNQSKRTCNRQLQNDTSQNLLEKLPSNLSWGKLFPVTELANGWLKHVSHQRSQNSGEKISYKFYSAQCSLWPLIKPASYVDIAHRSLLLISQSIYIVLHSKI